LSSFFHATSPGLPASSPSPRSSTASSSTSLGWVATGVARTTVEGYLEILEDTLLARRRRPSRQDMAGLRVIADLRGLRRRILVHRGDRATRTEDGIDAWPVSVFLEALESDRLWP
jgi:hypothetical protein